MNIKIVAPLLLAAAVASPANAQDGFSPYFYIAVGAGESRLTPDTSLNPAVSVVDDSDTAATASLGMDITRRLTAELHYADLGVSGLTGNDGISYEMPSSLSGIYYLWNGLSSSEYFDRDGLDQRAGFSLFGRVGVGKMKNSALQTVRFERENDYQGIGGLGVEYGTKFGLGVRAEYIKYDKDASFAGLNVLYRLGGNSSGGNRMPKASTQVNTQPKVEPIPDLPTLPQPEAPVELPRPPVPTADVVPTQTGGDLTTSVAPDDTDGDGIANQFDQCSQTSFGTPVDSSGCAMFNGTLEGVNFLTGSDTLTDDARVVLDEVARTLNNFADIRVSIESHTDDRGLESNNMALSRNRALAVVRYLIAQGVRIERMEARAFGETAPIADNDTRAGRLLNRRVEFRVVQ